MSFSKEESIAPYGNAVRTDEEHRRAFVTGRLPVAVYGLGKMGLPLAAVFADVTGNVTGVDVDETVVNRIEQGVCPVKGEPGLPHLLNESVTSGALKVTSDPTTAARGACIHVIIVPTEIRNDTEPDLSKLRTVTQDIGAGLSQGDLVIVESTVPPGTCSTLVEPILAAKSSLSTSEFGVAFCPERTSSGRALRDIRGSYPKVVGGIDPESSRLATIIYESITTNEIIAVSEIGIAECVKIFEGIYRDVNIALANEIAQFTDELGVDVNEAIRVANTQPYCDIHQPGPGVGGHCIPYYPYFLINPFETGAPLMKMARSVNDSMPLFTVGKLIEALGAEGIRISDATIALFGLTYRPGVEETRKTPARPIAEQLDALGARVIGVDPMLDDPKDIPVELIPLSSLEQSKLDSVVLVTPHEEFKSVPWNEFDRLVIIDSRNSLDLSSSHHRVYTVGSGYSK